MEKTVSYLNATFDVSTTIFTMTPSNESYESLPMIPDFSRMPLGVVLSVTAVSSNLLVMICIIKDEKLHRPANYYIFSLSVIEGFVALIPFNGFVIFDIFDGWPFGKVLCQVC